MGIPCAHGVTLFDGSIMLIVELVVGRFVESIVEVLGVGES